MSIDLLKLLIPPVDKDDPHATTWRFLMFLAILVIFAYILIAEGIILNNGHARASDLTKIQENFTSQMIEVRTTLDTLKLNGLEQSIERWHKRQCQALAANNQQARVFAQEQLREKLQEYLHITGQQYILFGCGA